MKRLCGLMLFCVGFGMTWALVLPTTFFLVLTAAALMIVGYNLWVKILSPLVLDSYFCRHKNQTKYCPLLNALHLIY